jgi:hypothetical protein
MANQDGDIIGRLLQELFSDRDRIKRLLEHLVNQAMLVVGACTPACPERG